MKYNVIEPPSVRKNGKISLVRWIHQSVSHFAVLFNDASFHIIDNRFENYKKASSEVINQTYSKMRIVENTREFLNDVNKTFFHPIQFPKDNVNLSYTSSSTDALKMYADFTCVINTTPFSNPYSIWQFYCNEIYDIKFSIIPSDPGNVVLALTSKDNYLKIYNLYHPSIVKIIKWYYGHFVAIEYSADGKILAASCANNSIIIFETDNYLPILSLIGHRSYPVCLRFDNLFEEILISKFNNYSNSPKYIQQKKEFDSILSKDLLNLDNYISYEDLSNKLYRLVSVGEDSNICFWDIDLVRYIKMFKSKFSESLPIMIKAREIEIPIKDSIPKYFCMCKKKLCDSSLKNCEILQLFLVVSNSTKNFAIYKPTLGNEIGFFRPDDKPYEYSDSMKRNENEEFNYRILRSQLPWNQPLESNSQSIFLNQNQKESNKKVIRNELNLNKYNSEEKPKLNKNELSKKNTDMKYQNAIEEAPEEEYEEAYRSKNNKNFEKINEKESKFDIPKLNQKSKVVQKKDNIKSNLNTKRDYKPKNDKITERKIIACHSINRNNEMNNELENNNLVSTYSKGDKKTNIVYSESHEKLRRLRVDDYEHDPDLSRMTEELSREEPNDKIIPKNMKQNLRAKKSSKFQKNNKGIPKKIIKNEEAKIEQKLEEKNKINPLDEPILTERSGLNPSETLEIENELQKNKLGENILMSSSEKNSPSNLGSNQNNSIEISKDFAQLTSIKEKSSITSSVQTGIKNQIQNKNDEITNKDEIKKIQNSESIQISGKILKETTEVKAIPQESTKEKSNKLQETNTSNINIKKEANLIDSKASNNMKINNLEQSQKSIQNENKDNIISSKSENKESKNISINQNPENFKVNDPSLTLVQDSNIVKGNPQPKEEITKVIQKNVSIHNENQKSSELQVLSEMKSNESSKNNSINQNIDQKSALNKNLNKNNSSLIPQDPKAPQTQEKVIKQLESETNKKANLELLSKGLSIDPNSKTGQDNQSAKSNSNQNQYHHQDGLKVNTIENAVMKDDNLKQSENDTSKQKNPETLLNIEYKTPITNIRDEKQIIISDFEQKQGRNNMKLNSNSREEMKIKQSSLKLFENLSSNLNNLQNAPKISHISSIEKERDLNNMEKSNKKENIISDNHESRDLIQVDINKNSQPDLALNEKNENHAEIINNLHSKQQFPESRNNVFYKRKNSNNKNPILPKFIEKNDPLLQFHSYASSRKQYNSNDKFFPPSNSKLIKRITSLDSNSPYKDKKDVLLNTKKSSIKDARIFNKKKSISSSEVNLINGIHSDSLVNSYNKNPKFFKLEQNSLKKIISQEAQEVNLVNKLYLPGNLTNKYLNKINNQNNEFLDFKSPENIIKKEEKKVKEENEFELLKKKHLKPLNTKKLILNKNKLINNIFVGNNYQDESNPNKSNLQKEGYSKHLINVFNDPEKNPLVKKLMLFQKNYDPILGGQYNEEFSGLHLDEIIQKLITKANLQNISNVSMINPVLSTLHNSLSNK